MYACMFVIKYNIIEPPSSCRSQFPEYDLEVINAGINSDRIANMRARTDRDVLSLKPDAVIVFWDSDVSDQSIEVLDRTETKIRYEEDLRAVLQNLKANCSHLSVSGTAYIHTVHTYIYTYIHTYIHT